MNRRKHYRRAGGAALEAHVSPQARQAPQKLPPEPAAHSSPYLQRLFSRDQPFVQMGCANNAGVRRTVKPGEGIVGRTATGNTGPIIVADPTKDEAFSRAVDVPSYGRHGADLGSCNNRANAGLMCGPVENGYGGVWGVLVVADPDGANGAFDEESLKTFK